MTTVAKRQKVELEGAWCINIFHQGEVKHCMVYSYKFISSNIELIHCVNNTQWYGMLTGSISIILVDKSITKELETLLSKKIGLLFPNQ